MSEHNWAQICSEIVVAAYGTRIISEWDGVGEYAPWGTARADEIAGWPLCVYPLEECRDDGSGTLHTYWYGPVPRYHDQSWQLVELWDALRAHRGWVYGSRTAGKFEARRTVAWVNKPPIAPNRSLMSMSVRAFDKGWAAAYVLAIHKALMEGAE